MVIVIWRLRGVIAAGAAGCAWTALASPADAEPVDLDACSGTLTDLVCDVVDLVTVDSTGPTDPTTPDPDGTLIYLGPSTAPAPPPAPAPADPATAPAPPAPAPAAPPPAPAPVHQVTDPPPPAPPVAVHAGDPRRRYATVGHHPPRGDGSTGPVPVSHRTETQRARDDGHPRADPVALLPAGRTVVFRAGWIVRARVFPPVRGDPDTVDVPPG